MHTVLLTPTFQSDADRAGLSDTEVIEIASIIADDPMGGALMIGTGGARKMRHRLAGSGKSGGLRTIHYFAGEDVPIFLLAVFRKGDKDNLSKSERNALATILPKLATHYKTRKAR